MKRAFTLIELLIVVAIIAILAAIAVPNFLEAQTRAKVSRVRADVRTIVTALESYAVDWNKYPPDCYFESGNIAGGVNYEPPQCADIGAIWYVNSSITSPVAYLSNADLEDPFNVQDPNLRNFRYTNFDHTYVAGLGLDAPPAAYTDLYQAYRVTSDGPDQSFTNGPTDPGYTTPSGLPMPFSSNLPYDATNGTISLGDIIRSQKFAEQ